MNKHLRTEQFDIAHFQDYVATYTERHPDNQNIMFLDMLYGVGICIDPDNYKGADGFKKFIEWIARAQEELENEEIMKEMIEAEIKREREIANKNNVLLSEIEKDLGVKYVEAINECLNESEAHGKLEIVKKSMIHKHINRQEEDWDEFDHIYVDQYVDGGFTGDEFAGYIYIPLKKGKYLKSHYSM